MKYGGELVAAEDCDYDSFKELVPLCPNCKEPVFLRIGGDRLSVKGNEYKVGPHWCHFKGISAEQVASCESRVSGYTEQDRQRIAAKARGQRLKLLQRWFWSVICRNNNQDIQQLLEDIKPEIKGQNLAIQKMAESCIANLLKSSDPFADAVYFLEKIVDTGTKYGDDVSKERNIIDKMPEIESKLHSNIVKEVVSFLVSKRNLSIIYDILTLRVYTAFCNEKEGLDLEKELFETLTIPERSAVFGYYAVLKEIAFIPWASEFQRLEAESKQQKMSA